MPRTKRKTLHDHISPYIIPTVVVSFALITAISIGYKIYADSQYESLQVEQEDEMTEEERLLEERTQTWDTYQNEEQNFALKFPQRIVHDKGDAPIFAKSGVCTMKETQVLTLEPIQFDEDSLPHEVYADFISVKVHAEDARKGITVNDWIEENCTALGLSSNDIQKRRVEVDGEQAYQTITAGDDPYVVKTKQTFVIHSNRIYIITTSYSYSQNNKDRVIQTEPMLEDVLATFRFLE